MDILQRNKQPNFHTIEHLELLPTEQTQLSNHIPFYHIHGGTQEVVQIDFLFQAGIWYQPAPIIAAMTNSMLNEGTKNYTAAQIAEKLDFYGAYIGFSTSQHQASITLYTLNKYLEQTIAIAEDLIKNPIFPEKEFATILNNKRQNYAVEQQKPRILAKDHFCSLLYGKDHPYANIISSTDFENVTPKQLQAFHASRYRPENCQIIAAGKIATNTIELLEKHFGHSSWPENLSSQLITHPKNCSSPRKNWVEKDDAVQCAIRIGRPLFNKNHPDYIGMQLLNMILGGYFGSRLMSNIREDKGYTYGINSALVPFEKGGHFMILTEVGTQFCEPALQEIYSELNKLRNQTIPNEELTLVKNYITGEILRNMDGPFALADSLKNNLCFGLNNKYYQKFIMEIKEISAQQLQNLANKYLKEKDLYEVVVGKK